MTEPSQVTARRRAVAVAGHAGDERSARAGLQDSEATVRATALGALARLGRLNATDLESAAGDRDPVVRARAAELAGVGSEVGSEPGNEAAHGGSGGWIVALLDDPVAMVVEAACFGLGEMGEATCRIEAAVETLGRVARTHSDALCREAAVAALGAIGADAGLEAVLAAMADKPAVRRRAVLALAAFEGPEVEAALERALADRDWQVRQAAEDLTGQRETGPAGRPSRRADG